MGILIPGPVLSIYLINTSEIPSGGQGRINNFGIRRKIGGRVLYDFQRECRVKMFMLPVVGYGYFFESPNRCV